jgi:hypothetical protein
MGRLTRRVPDFWCSASDVVAWVAKVPGICNHGHLAVYIDIIPIVPGHYEHQTSRIEVSLADQTVDEFSKFVNPGTIIASKKIVIWVVHTVAGQH